MKQNFIEDKTGTLRLSIYDNNRLVVPTSGTVTLYKPGSDTELQAAAAVTIAATGEMTYALTATHTADHDCNYKAVWAYVISGVTYYETRLFDVVKSQLSIPVTDDDILNELETLRKAYAQASGTLTNATAGSFVDTLRRKEADDYWKGGTVSILFGTGAGQSRDVAGFAQAVSSGAVSPNWTTTPDSTSVYRLVRSFTLKIAQAFEKLEQMLYDKGKRDSLILENSQIKFPLIYLVITNICEDLMDEEGDKWDMLRKTYADKFEKSFNTMRLEYDEDESGNISEDESQKGVTEIRIGRA